MTNLYRHVLTGARVRFLYQLGSAARLLNLSTGERFSVDWPDFEASYRPERDA